MASRTEKMLLSVNDVFFRYDLKTVLNDFKLTLSHGELVGIVGPNGCGKSTLLNLISGVLKPNTGTILINGMDIRKFTSKEIAKKVAVVPQIATIPPNLQAIEVALMGRTPYLGTLQWESNNDYEKVRDSMEMTNCWELHSQRIGMVSGGERQRIILARALVQDTPILLLDEPTASLDLGSQINTFELLIKLITISQKAILVAIHDITLASQYCDRIVLVHEGCKIAEGTPSEVLTVKNLHAVYGVETDLMSHPRTGLPVVIPRPITENRSDLPNHP